MRVIVPAHREDLWGNESAPLSLDVVSSTEWLSSLSYTLYEGDVNQTPSTSLLPPSTASSLTGTRQGQERYKPKAPIVAYPEKRSAGGCQVFREEHLSADNGEQSGI